VSSALTIVDTGILVAILNRKEEHHEWALETSRSLPAPFLTCEAVLTEAFFLTSALPGGSQRFFELLCSGMLAVDFSVLEERDALQKLIHKYQNLPMSLADACLVRLAELHPKSSVFTLDAHFRVYRKHGRQQIPVVMP
jgi:predicted nucleic acid-binding protein